MFFNNYKELYEKQKKIADEAIETANKWKELSLNQAKSLEEQSKTIDDSIRFIKKLQDENAKLALLCLSKEI